MAEKPGNEKVEVTITRERTVPQTLMDGTTMTWKQVSFTWRNGSGRVTLPLKEATPERIQEEIRKRIKERVTEERRETFTV